MNLEKILFEVEKERRKVWVKGVFEILSEKFDFSSFPLYQYKELCKIIPKKDILNSIENRLKSKFQDIFSSTIEKIDLWKEYIDKEILNDIIEERLESRDKDVFESTIDNFDIWEPYVDKNMLNRIIQKRLKSQKDIVFEKTLSKIDIWKNHIDNSIIYSSFERVFKSQNGNLFSSTFELTLDKIDIWKGHVDEKIIRNSAQRRLESQDDKIFLSTLDRIDIWKDYVDEKIIRNSAQRRLESQDDKIFLSTLDRIDIWKDYVDEKIIRNTIQRRLKSQDDKIFLSTLDRIDIWKDYVDEKIIRNTIKRRLKSKNNNFFLSILNRIDICKDYMDKKIIRNRIKEIFDLGKYVGHHSYLKLLLDKIDILEDYVDKDIIKTIVENSLALEEDRNNNDILILTLDKIDILKKYIDIDMINNIVKRNLETHCYDSDRTFEVALDKIETWGHYVNQDIISDIIKTRLKFSNNSFFKLLNKACMLEKYIDRNAIKDIIKYRSRSKDESVFRSVLDSINIWKVYFNKSFIRNVLKKGLESEEDYIFSKTIDIIDICQDYVGRDFIEKIMRQKIKNKQVNICNLNIYTMSNWIGSISPKTIIKGIAKELHFIANPNKFGVIRMYNYSFIDFCEYLVSEKYITEPIKDNTYNIIRYYLSSISKKKTKLDKNILQEIITWVQNPKGDYKAMVKILQKGKAKNLEEVVECSEFEATYEDFFSILGSGANGTTYLVYSNEFKQNMVMKIVSDSTISQKEKEELAKIPYHPNIVRVYGTGPVKRNGEKVNAILMEYVEGEDLYDLILTHKNGLETKLVLNYGGKILDTIGHMSKYGQEHRDLHPRNIRVTSEGVIKVVDFGIARDIEESNGYDVQFNRRYGGPNDIFSWGLIMYEMCTGKHLIIEKEDGMGYETFANKVQFMKQRMRRKSGKIKPYYIKRIKDNVPEDLQDIIFMSLENVENYEVKDLVSRIKGEITVVSEFDKKAVWEKILGYKISNEQFLEMENT